MVEPKRTAKFKQQRFTLPKGLTRMEAAKAAQKRATRDYRGMQYDPKTGKTVLT